MGILRGWPGPQMALAPKQLLLFRDPTTSPELGPGKVRLRIPLLTPQNILLPFHIPWCSEGNAHDQPYLRHKPYLSSIDDKGRWGTKALVSSHYPSRP